MKDLLMLILMNYALFEMVKKCMRNLKFKIDVHLYFCMICPFWFDLGLMEFGLGLSLLR